MMHRVSAQDVPSRHKLPYLHDFVSSHVAGLCFEPCDAERFDFDVGIRALGSGIVIGQSRYGATAIERTRSRLADGREGFSLTWHDADYVFETAGKSWQVRAGDLTVTDETRPFRLRLPAARMKLVSLDRRRMIAAAPRIAARPFHHFPADAPGTAFLAGYIGLIADMNEAGGGDAACDLIYRLVAHRIEDNASGTPGEDDLATARLRLIKAEIDRRHAHADFRLDDLARAHGLSGRYLQQLFAREGTSFSDYLRDRRADYALRQLERPDQLHRSIADIAFDAGFGDLSSFNRAFRKRFGVTPRDIRARTLLAADLHRD